jgi:hypothetical protein
MVVDMLLYETISIIKVSFFRKLFSLLMATFEYCMITSCIAIGIQTFLLGSATRLPQPTAFDHQHPTTFLHTTIF